MIQSTSGPESLVLVKPLGRPLNLAPGETLQAQVTDTYPPDGVSLNLKGTFIPARSSVPLEKGATVLLKVMSLDEKTGQVSLQLIGGPKVMQAMSAQAAEPSGAVRAQAIGSLLDELSALLDRGSSGDGSGIGAREKYQAALPVAAGARDSNNTEGLRKVITALITSLPSSAASLPAHIRIRLQEALHRSLSATGRNICSRMEALARSLPPEMKTDALTEAMRPVRAFASDGLRSSDLRQAFEDSGVLLEAKLKSIAGAREQSEENVDAEQGQPRSGSPQTVGTDNARSKAPPELEGDLKAHLLRLRQVLAKDQQASPVKTVLRTLTATMGIESAESAAPHHAILRTIDGILCDIETYQLLSKATESFQTFLPLLWDRLKDGEICFRKKQRGSSKGVYSCRLTLDLERLGTLSAHIVMQNDTFSVSFKAAQPGLRKTLSSHMRQLEEAFQRRGLCLAGTFVAAEDDCSFDELDAAWSLDAGLNIRV